MFDDDFEDDDDTGWDADEADDLRYHQAKDDALTEVDQ